MLITVSLSVEEYKQLQQLSQFRANMEAETLLRCLAGDLIDSSWSGGSDEGMYAHQWLERRFGAWWHAKELADELKAEKREAKKARKQGGQS